MLISRWENTCLVIYFVLHHGVPVHPKTTIFIFATTSHTHTSIPNSLFGVTTLDVVRASRFVSEVKKIPTDEAKITVIGGHSGVTIVPLLSQSGHSFTDAEVKALTKRIQFGGDEVVQAKSGTGSATLSMAFAGARFTNSLLEAIVGGKKGVIEPTFVKSDIFAAQGVEYFATNVELGPQGVTKIHPVGKVNAYEQGLIDAAIPELQGNITKGKAFAKA